MTTRASRYQFRKARALTAREWDRSLWRHLATHNDTTDLPDRRALLAHLKVTFSLGEPLGVVLIDLDRFKQVNDTFGHEHGNDLLYAVGRRLVSLRPSVELAAHLSGDEFALVVHGGDAEVMAAAEAAYRRLAGLPYDVNGRQVVVTASVGYAVAEPGMLPRDLLQAADQAMYLAKRAGRGPHSHDPAHRPPPGTATRYRDLR